MLPWRPVVSIMSSEDFEDKIELLNSTLHDSIERLLQEAKKKGVLLPPFGRPPTPTPFVDEDEEIVQDLDATTEDTRNEDDVDDVTNFKYQYGFNPLEFLADLLHLAHPQSVAKRRQQRSLAQQRLCSRAKHAHTLLSTAEGLKERTLQLRR